MKILITGGSGFVGSNVAIAIKTQHPDWDILALDNLKRRGSELNIKELVGHGIEFHHGDIRNDDDLEQFSGLTCIIDASAEPSVVAGLNSGQKQVININLLGTINLMNLATAHGADFIFLSTSRIYPIERLNKIRYIEEDTRFSIDSNQSITGVSPQGITENFPLDGFRSYYGATKLAAEVLLEEYCKYGGIKAVVNRFGVIAGPRQMGKVDQGVAVLWMARHFWKGKLGYFGYGGLGKQVRDMLHIDDVCDLILHQLSNLDQYNGQVINVGGGLDTSLSLLEMTHLCQEISGNKIEINPVLQDREADIRIYISDCSKINNLTGWKPKRSTTDIFRDIYDWLHDNEHSLKQYLN